MNDVYAKYYFRQRFKDRIHDAVIGALDNASVTSGIRKTDIAKRLQINPSQVDRWLADHTKWEIDTISDLLFAVDSELDVQVMRSLPE